MSSVISDFLARLDRKADEVGATRKLYHIADKVDFRLDPTRHPENNTTLGGDWPEAGIFLTSDPEHWLNGYGYWRPWIVEFSVPEGIGSDFSSETFIPATDFNKVTITRVLPLDGYARETYRNFGWMEDDLGVDSFTGDPIPAYSMGAPWPRPPEGWTSPDAREMDRGWVSDYAKKVRKWRRTRNNAIAGSSSFIRANVIRDGDGDGFIEDGTPRMRPVVAVPVQSKADPRDGDGDGMIEDGTPSERPIVVHAPTDLVMSIMQQARSECDPEDPEESVCYDASAVTQDLLNGAGVEAYMQEGTWRDYSHVYVVEEGSGRIFDPTLDQFYPGGRGNVSADWASSVWGERDDLPPYPRGWKPSDGPAIISPDDPFAQHYMTHRKDGTNVGGDLPYWVSGQEPPWWSVLHGKPEQKSIRYWVESMVRRDRRGRFARQGDHSVAAHADIPGIGMSSPVVADAGSLSNHDPAFGWASDIMFAADPNRQDTTWAQRLADPNGRWAGSMEYRKFREYHNNTAAIDGAFSQWRNSFSASQSMRAIAEGKDPAPAYMDSPYFKASAEIVRRAVQDEGKPIGKVSYRMAPGNPVTKVGESIDFSLAATAATRQDALGYRMTFIGPAATADSTLFIFPPDTKGYTFPDGREHVVSGHFIAEHVYPPDDERNTNTGKGIWEVHLGLAPVETKPTAKGAAVPGKYLWHVSSADLPVGTVLTPSGPGGPESVTRQSPPGREDDRNWVWMTSNAADAKHTAIQMIAKRDPDKLHAYLVEPDGPVETRSYDFSDVPVARSASVVAKYPGDLVAERTSLANTDFEVNGATEWGMQGAMALWQQSVENPAPDAIGVSSAVRATVEFQEPGMMIVWPGSIIRFDNQETGTSVPRGDLVTNYKLPSGSIVDGKITGAFLVVGVKEGDRSSTISITPITDAEAERRIAEAEAERQARLAALPPPQENWTETGLRHLPGEPTEHGVLYHGSQAKLADGDTLVPFDFRTDDGPPPDTIQGEPVVWMTESRAEAAFWAGKGGTVYEVEPNGITVPDIDYKGRWVAKSGVVVGSSPADEIPGDGEWPGGSSAVAVFPPPPDQPGVKAKPRLFHGTRQTIPSGSTLVPGGPNGDLVNGGKNQGSWVWLTESPGEALDWASWYADNGDGTTRREKGHVYEVDTSRAVQIRDIPDGPNKPIGGPGAWVAPVAVITAEVGPRGGVIKGTEAPDSIGASSAVVAGRNSATTVDLPPVGVTTLPVGEGEVQAEPWRGPRYQVNNPAFTNSMSRSTDGFYSREDVMRRAGMPKGQVFQTADQIAAYMKPLLPEGITPHVMISKALGGQGASILSKDEKDAWFGFTKDMTDEATVLHEIAHIRVRAEKGKRPASHGVDFAGEWAKLMHEQLGWGMSFGVPEPIDASSAIVATPLQLDPADSRFINTPAGKLFGKGIDAAFHSESGMTTTPWPSMTKRRDLQDYDTSLVQEALAAPHRLQDFDPRDLWATQPNVTQPGVEYYMGNTYLERGLTYEVGNNPGNRYPVVYRRSDGQNLILSGHHRAMAALLSGQPLRAIMIDGPFGPPRQGVRQ